MRIIRFVFISLLVILSHNSTAAQSEAPYIFYHSPVLNAIVIERADGSDSRTLGEGLMPANHSIVSGPGWSPSGKWFAWTSTYDAPYRSGPNRIWVVSTDGKRRLDTLDDVSHAVSAVWSPTGDFLFVVDVNSESANFGVGTPDNPGHELYLIDVEHEKVVAFFDNIIVESLEGAAFSPWSQTGDNVFFYYNVFNLVGDTLTYGESQTRVLYSDGHYEDNVQKSDLEPRVVIDWQDSNNVEISISPDGRYTASNTLTLTDSKSGTAFHMRPFSAGERFNRANVYSWHPDSRWLMREDYLEGTYRGMVSVLNVEGTVSREFGQCSLSDGTCANWLPVRVVPYLAPGQPTSVMPDPVLTLFHEGFVLGVGWKRDGTGLATYEELIDERDEYRLHLWAFDGKSASQIKTFVVDACYEWMLYSCRLEWNSSGTKIALAGIGTTQIIDAETGELLFTTPDDFGGWINDEEYYLFQTPSAYDPVHHRLTRSDSAQTITIEDVRSHQIEQSFTWPEGDVFRLMFLPNRNQLAVLVYPDEPTIDVYVWDLETNNVRAFPKLDMDYQTDVMTTDDYVVAYGRATLVYFWNPADGKVVARLNRYAAGIDFGPDRYLATASSKVAEIWDLGAIIH